MGWRQLGEASFAGWVRSKLCYQQHGPHRHDERRDGGGRRPLARREQLHADAAAVEHVARPLAQPKQVALGDGSCAHKKITRSPPLQTRPPRAGRCCLCPSEGPRRRGPLCRRPAAPKASKMFGSRQDLKLALSITIICCCISLEPPPIMFSSCGGCGRSRWGGEEGGGHACWRPNPFWSREAAAPALRSASAPRGRAASARQAQSLPPFAAAGRSGRHRWRWA